MVRGLKKLGLNVTTEGRVGELASGIKYCRVPNASNGSAVYRVYGVCRRLQRIRMQVWPGNAAVVRRQRVLYSLQLTRALPMPQRLRAVCPF